MKKNSFNFTQVGIEKLPIPERGRAQYYDTKEPNLELRITDKGNKTYNYYKWRKGHNRPDRIKIGDAKLLSVNYAREQASIIAGDIAKGLHPKEQEYGKTTFAQFFPIYIEKWCMYHKKLKSRKDDQNLFDSRLKESFIANKCLDAITHHDIVKLHQQVGKTAKVRANRIVALLSTIFNKAIKWGYAKKNPCIGIEKFKEVERERFLQSEEMPRFYYALEFVKPKYKSFFLMLLYTGVRSGNVKAMRWDQINYNLKMWSIPITKNGKPQNIPLSDNVLELLKERKGESNVWVFPSDSSESGHIEEAKKPWRLIRQMSGLHDLRMHDLRRSFGSWLAINGESLILIGKVLNHDNINSTSIYSRLSIDVVREAMEQAQRSIIGYSRASHSLRDFLGWSLTNNHNITLKYRYLSQLTYLLSLQAYRLNRRHK